MKHMIRAIGRYLGEVGDLFQLAFGDREAVFKRDSERRYAAAMKRLQH
jgi:hypothetical protein